MIWVGKKNASINEVFLMRIRGIPEITIVSGGLSYPSR